MDKYGSALTHAKDPNFQCSPFFHVSKGRKYSLLWPVKDITKGNMCTRNFLPRLMQNETPGIYKARLKAFTGNKICKQVESKTPSEEKGEKKDEMKGVEIEEIVANVDSKEEIVVNGESKEEISVYLSIYSTHAGEKLPTNLKIEETLNDRVDITVSPLKEKCIKLDSDVLPLSDLISNKGYMLNYLQYQLGECAWIPTTYILPRQIEAFNKEFELSNLPQFWIVKQVDSRTIGESEGRSN